ncbi:hypothetical protein CWO91_25225 [Bradyrhizobium genosp. SA-3]|uniref:hypothetical protein n=1 Tax=Bradyrhizobium genosp. SA-3 TaxID=508868 RepID=UPI001029B53D|nr:hypothetical protein [Bradyrhizobium genosp. SA-3]RZN07877.1 hypothetical protein CWO91_25225 [Bradyrhizobium genosp. SA-3]
MTNFDRQITQWVKQTPFIDTHEHLIEESRHLCGVLDPQFLPCDDWTYLFTFYVADDLVAAGMPVAELQSFLGPNLSSKTKYRLVAPYWDLSATPAMPKRCATIRTQRSTCAGHGLSTRLRAPEGVF